MNRLVLLSFAHSFDRAETHPEVPCELLDSIALLALTKIKGSSGKLGIIRRGSAVGPGITGAISIE